MILVEKFIILLQLSQIPAKIQIITVHIRDFQDWAVRFQHKNICHRRRTGRIHPVAEFVQKPVIFQQIFIDRAGRGYFVAQSPDNDGRMIITLSDQFLHLTQRIVPAVFHVHGDIGNLRPDNDTVFVTQVIKFIRVLVMCEAQRIGTDLPDDFHIFPMMFDHQRISDAFMVLMAADAPQRIAPPI